VRIRVLLPVPDAGRPSVRRLLALSATTRAVDSGGGGWGVLRVRGFEGISSLSSALFSAVASRSLFLFLFF
jgi:hypothetical protein